MAKPKAIQRDSTEVVEEAVMGAARGGVIGFLASFAVGAFATAAVLTLGVGIVTALSFGALTFPGVMAAAAGTITGLSLVGGAAASFLGGGVSALAGGLIGGAKTASRVERENAAYAAKMKEKTMGREEEIITARNEAMQMGFQAGAEQGRAVGQQEGAQMVLAKLQEHAAQENAGHGAGHGHAEHAKPPHEGVEKSFAAAEAERRSNKEAAAAAGAHIG